MERPFEFEGNLQMLIVESEEPVARWSLNVHIDVIELL